MAYAPGRRASEHGLRAAAAALLAALTLAAPAMAQTLSGPREVRLPPAAGGSGTSRVAFGIYDPLGAFAKSPGIAIEHVFMPWEDVDLGSLDQADAYARQRNRRLLVTLEPWSWSQTRKYASDELRDGIRAGSFDARIRAICGKLGGLKSVVTVRWGHEMELKNRRYPWSDWQPADYVSAYRRVVDICRASAPGLRFMWSPRGESDLEDYYPGDAYVDEVGLSVFGMQTYDEWFYGARRTLADLLMPSYRRAERLGKPLFVAEFGCLGDADYIARCEDFSAATLGMFPLLAGIIYYSEIDTGPWPPALGKPDWRVRPAATGSNKS